MSLVEHSGEELARFIDRRKLLKRAAIAIFSLTTATVINLDHMFTAHASSYCPYPNITPKCDCNPPGGRYCFFMNPSYCNGHICAGKCTPFTAAWPNSGGCWCTEICADGCNDAYSVCCDCTCPGNTCTCSQIYYYGSKPNC